VWGAQNYTYKEDAQGLVAWLNEKIAKSSFRAVHVTLPTGNVSRGTGELIGLSIGLNLVIQGQGMDGATATTLNLQQKNLDIGAMLGETGRIEFRNMGITNVRVAMWRRRSSCRNCCCLCRAILPRYHPHTADCWPIPCCVCLPTAMGSCVEGIVVVLRPEVAGASFGRRGAFDGRA
jgi:hypothetical protein